MANYTHTQIIEIPIIASTVVKLWTRWCSKGNLPTVIEVHTGSLGWYPRFTVVLVDADGEEAYPLPGYTYMILRMDAFDSCDKAVQLYRYIDWFTTHPDAQRECEKLFMAPVR